jgi:[ribosomal protein S5]-alanine N-acetyltransferase
MEKSKKEDKMKIGIPMIKTERLILRELQHSDIKDIFENLNDLEVSKQLRSVPHPCTETNTKDHVIYYMDEYKKKTKDNYGYCIEYDKKAIGIISLDMINRKQMNCFLDYWIGQRYWRKGIGFEAAFAIVDFAFKNLGLKTIESAAFADNLASQKLLEKLGFKKQHFLEKHAKSQADGKVHDFCTFLLKKEEWKKAKKRIK